MRHPELTDHVLAMEKEALMRDKKLYMECMNYRRFCDRETIEDQRQGLIIFWSVYIFIKNSSREKDEQILAEGKT